MRSVSASLREASQRISAPRWKPNADLDVQRYIDSHYSRPLASLYIGLARNGQVVLRGSGSPV